MTGLWIMLALVVVWIVAAEVLRVKPIFEQEPLPNPPEVYEGEDLDEGNPYRD